MSSEPILHEVVDRVCVGQYISKFSSTKKFHCFQPKIESSYQAYCDDFGPLNLAAVMRFIDLLDKEIATHQSGRIVYCVDPGRRALANAVFLVGAYLILKLNMESSAVSTCFHWLSQSIIEDYRDASLAEPDFALNLNDCWCGLERSKLCGWIGPPTPDGDCGQIYIPDYVHLDNPLNADLNPIVPGALFALRGPRNLGPHARYMDMPTHREFSPAHTAEILLALGVTDVVQLSTAPAYNPEDFVSRGLRHHSLPFADGAPPPPAVAERFLALAAAARPGAAVAVHCGAGLGRTGMLAALHLIRAHGFAPRQAIAWVRIMRPGSVLGPQQHYLDAEGDARGVRVCAMAAAAAAAAAASTTTGTPGRAGAAPLPACANVRGRIYRCCRASGAGPVPGEDGPRRRQEAAAAAERRGIRIVSRRGKAG